MSGGEPSETADLLEGTVLEEQLDQCDAIMGDIMEERLDPTDEENIYTRIDFQYGRTKDKTLEVLSDRFEAEGLNTALKTLISGIIECQGFHAKLERNGQRDDSLETVTRWFKLYAAVVLEKQPDIPFEFVLTQFKKYRDVVIVHPDGIPTATDKPEASLLGFLTLSWTAMEEILRLWQEILSKSDVELIGRESALDGNTPKHGFIHNLSDTRGFVTAYPEGQEGDDTHFDLDSAEYFPKEGDVVELEDEESAPHHDARTANSLRKYDP
ncbi:hypothetical protein [Halococcus saccharolyticus]|uniref:Uncharacterized protein n=1 Tax=Halococcus saccharolyticus DSM 5350 TaxID=1227455 RepID=M0MET3_9EURY|nr:hypothetical protein [Halococcus saccharolyticus]EMA44262.1 hypothetical protein C449_12068 [Halococcus saccharolyticus DSM 5350]